MPRMVPNDPYDKRIVSDRVKKVTLFMIFEGLAEMQYFTELKNRGLLKDGSMITEIQRRGIDKDNSDRASMIEMAHDFIIFRTTGRCTLRRYVTTVLNEFFREYKGDIGENYKESIDIIRKFRMRLCESYVDSPDVESGVVKEGSLLYKDIESRCNETFMTSFELMDTDRLSGYASPPRPTDRIFVVYDRDYNEQYFDMERYNACLDLCVNKYHYTPLITSPQFEFWLMLHLDNIEYGVPSYRPNYYRGHIVSQQMRAGDIYAQPGSGSKFEKDLGSRLDLYLKGLSKAIVRIRDRDLFTIDESRLKTDAERHLSYSLP